MATIYDCVNQTNHELYQEIKKFYEEAYQCIDKALLLDEAGKRQEAIEMYEFGLTLMDQALNMPIESPTQPDIEWEKTYAMIQKMRKSKKEILGRISDVQVREHPDAAVPPPSYEEAIASGPSTSTASAGFRTPSSPIPAIPPSPVYQPASASIDLNLYNNPASSYAELNNQIGEMRVTGNREIIYSHNNVRLYFIAPDGRVSATSQPDTLVIGRIEDMTHDEILDDTLLTIVEQLAEDDGGGRKKSHHRHHGHHHRRRHGHGHGRRRHSSETAQQLPQGTGQVYLQVGSWVYPLLPGISPVFRSDYGAFILPDVHSELEGAAVGIILPANADKSVHELLNNILLGVVGANDLISKEPVPPTRSRRSHRPDATGLRPETGFSKNLVRGATYLANNLVRGAGSASRFIDATAPKIMNRMTPAAEPQPVNPTIKTTVGVAKTVSGTTATVSDYLGKVGSAASALGQYLAPHIQRGGTRLLASTTKMSTEEASSKVETFLGATASAVQGIGTVYSGLETSAGILGRSLSNNTIQIIEYKYGKPVGAVSEDALATAGNMSSVYGNYKLLKPTKVAKTIAKGAVSGAFHEAHSEFQGPGPGDGSGFGPPSSVELGSEEEKKFKEPEKEKK